MPRNHYNTRQRERILAALAGCGDEHVTVAQMVELLSAGGAPVGRTTIYRYLEELAAQGLARKYTPASGASACYQYVGEAGACHEHYHLQCTGCGRLFHVSCEYIDAAAQHVLRHHGFALDGGRTVLVGLCRECAQGGKDDGSDDAASCDAQL